MKGAKRIIIPGFDVGVQQGGQFNPVLRVNNETRFVKRKELLRLALLFIWGALR